MTDNINDLIKRLANDPRDNDAMRELMEYLYASIRHCISLIVRDNETVKDVIQDTLITVWAKAPKLRKFDHCAGWVTSIARNRAIDYFNKQKIKFTISYDSEYNMRLLDHFASKTGNSLDKSICIKDYLSSLPEEDRQVIMLIGASYTRPEVAHIMNTSGRHIRYVVDKVREELKKEFA